MFDNLITGDEKASPIDALLKLLEVDDINIKTSLEMPHIRFLMKNRWLYLVKTYPDKEVPELMDMLMQYYKELMPSYKGVSRQQIVEGIKEMKSQLLEGGLQELFQQK